MKTPIIYSHGFGVDKTARGMFSDLSLGMSDRLHVFFDYNTQTKDGVEAATFESQTQNLQSQIDNLLKEGFEYFDLICHSQGAVAPTLLQNIDQIRKVIFLTPPRNLNISKMNAIFGERAGTIHHSDGKIFKVPRRDGSMTTIPMEYWESRERLNLGSLYKEFTSKVPTYVIFAKDDEVLGSENSTNFTEFIKSQIIIPGNHNFTDPSDRANMIKIVCEILDY